MTQISKDAHETLNMNRSKTADILKAEDQTAFIQSNYISNFAQFPIYNNTYTEYLPMGEP